MWSRFCFVASMLAIGSSSFPALADAPDSNLPVLPGDGMGGHGALAAEQAGPFARLLDAAPGWRAAIRNDPPGKPRLTREVMGYLPYWSYTASTPWVPLRWDLISTLAWFGVSMDATGRASNLRGWGGATTGRIVEEAHRHGVKVIVTITNFSGSEITEIVGTATNRQRAIETCLGLLDMHAADGINIDFEFVPRVSKADFVTFMVDLKAAVAARRPNGHEGHVSLAGPAVDWHGAYDYRALLEGTDGIMVMAYGYHWSGGNPGPTAPLEAGNIWRSRSIAWTVDDYIRQGGAENRHKVLIGLPWYGRAWEVADTTIPGTSLASAGAKFYRVAEPEALRNDKRFEPVSQTAWYHVRTDGKLHQVWYDDEASLTAKIGWVNDQDLGGIGIWALGYEGSGPALWDAIDVTIGPRGPDWVEPGEQGPEAGPEGAPEQVVVETDTEVEPSPEPVPEMAAEPAFDVAQDDAVAGSDVGDSAGVVTGRPGRRLELSVRQSEEGCGGGSWPAWPGLGVWFLYQRMRRPKGRV